MADFRLPPVTKDGKPIVSAWPTDGVSEALLISQDFTKRQTWYDESVKVVDDVAVCQDPGTYATYKLSYGNVIDTSHGLLPDEDLLVAPDGGSYRPLVTVNGVAYAEKDAHTLVGQYTLNYESGVLTFEQPLTSSDEVKATYYRADTSGWWIRPKPGKQLKLVKAEMQMSDDVIFADTICVQVWVEAYGVKVRETKYKGIRDILNEAQGTYPHLGPTGGTNWRGLSSGVSTFRFVYMSMSTLKSSETVAMRVCLEHDTPFQGEYGTVTFYCLSEDE